MISPSFGPGLPRPRPPRASATDRNPCLACGWYVPLERGGRCGVCARLHELAWVVSQYRLNVDERSALERALDGILRLVAALAGERTGPASSSAA